ncbi:MAG: hypothetical protein PWQ29_347 [Verrucomicrobiota bacterium]|jgi:HSP20 family protein|nr:hypothetical protein [Verrucomicrobiota bacterium]MDK2962953.1 hypothetical protein [Verrucomicrobiota bacterium]
MVKNLIPWRKKREELSAAQRERDPFDLLRRQMNELFDGFFEEFDNVPGVRSPLFGTRRGESATPRFEVSETEDDVVVKAELPGMNEKDIDVIIDNEQLTIRGEKKTENEKKKRNYTLSECFYGQFSRSIPLPAGIDREKAEAEFKRGVLTLTLPKTAAGRTKARRITVQAG